MHGIYKIKINKKLLLVGEIGCEHVGAQLKKASDTLGINAELINSKRAFSKQRILQSFVWRALKKPVYIKTFSKNLVCQALKEKCIVITTGISPVDSTSIALLEKQGVRCINYSTDDPWNTSHKSKWHLEALKKYSFIFTTRRSNLPDFAKIRKNTTYLPFGYDPDLYYPDTGCLISEIGGGEKEELFFAGACDRNRAELIAKIQKAGINLSIWGGFWDRYGIKNNGLLGAHKIRKEAAISMVSLLLVRKANRDGSAMRSFEIPACGACCVAEDTEEHREMFGPDGEAVLYFRTPEELVRRVKEAFVNPELRQRLRRNAHKAITGRPNTYVDRLKTILERVEEKNRIGNRG